MEWNTQIINWNVKNKSTVKKKKKKSYFTYRVSQKITIFVGLMYRGSTLLYTQDVLVYTKSITQLQTKWWAILR